MKKKNCLVWFLTAAVTVGAFPAAAEESVQESLSLSASCMEMEESTVRMQSEPAAEVQSFETDQAETALQTEMVSVREADPQTEGVTEAQTKTEISTEAQTQPAPQTEGATEGQTQPESQTEGATEGQTQPEEATEGQTDGMMSEDGDDVIGNGTETQTESGEADDSEQGSEANQEAFDMVILEDEFGIMEQEPVQPRTEAAAEETEKELLELTETEKPVLDISFSVMGEKVTCWGEDLLAFQAYPVGDLSQNESLIYQYLREELGLNKAAASGVLANILCESGFSTVAVGDSGTSYGLCQWHAGRFSSLVAWCTARGYNYHLLEGQLAYLKAELEGGYYGVYQYLLQVPDTARGAYQAGYYWCMHYEIPSDTVSRSMQRGRIAMNNYYPADLDNMEENGLMYGKYWQRLLDELLIISDPQEKIQAITDNCLYVNFISVPSIK